MSHRQATLKRRQRELFALDAELEARLTALYDDPAWADQLDEQMADDARFFELHPQATRRIRRPFDGEEFGPWVMVVPLARGVRARTSIDSPYAA